MSIPTDSDAPDPRRRGDVPRGDRATDNATTDPTYVHDAGTAPEHGTYIAGDGDAGHGSDEPAPARIPPASERDDLRGSRRVPEEGPLRGDRTETRPASAESAVRPSREEIVAREKDRLGGFKFGSAFFGWLCATGMVVLLTALVAGIAAAVGAGTGADPDQVADQATQNLATVGLVGAIAVLVILLVSYYVGGYVAGRMARFSGAKQGLAVWLWAVVVAVVMAIVAGVAGAQWNVLANVNVFPRLPVDEGELTAAGIVTAVGALLVSLAGAVLGGLAGMHYHRKVDRAGWDR